MIIIWNGMRLRVLEVFPGHFGESRLMVCKEFADPIMGRFSIRTADTALEGLIGDTP